MSNWSEIVVRQANTALILVARVLYHQKKKQTIFICGGCVLELYIITQMIS